MSTKWIVRLWAAMAILEWISLPMWCSHTDAAVGDRQFMFALACTLLWATWLKINKLEKSA